MSNSNSSVTQKHASVFELNGIPSFAGTASGSAACSCMIVGCVTPSIIVAGVAGINAGDRVILIQAALFCSAISTLLQLFPFIKFRNFQLGSASRSFWESASPMYRACRRLPELTILPPSLEHRLWAASLHHSRLLHQEDPSPFPAPCNRNCCFHHRTFSVSHCCQLHGRRNFQ